MEKARVVVWGVGRLGSEAVRMMLNKEWTEIVGAIDIDKGKVGKDLGEVVNAGRRLGIVVSDNPEDVFSKTKTDIVLHLTIGYTEQLEAQVMKCIEARSNVITSCATRLAYPWAHWPELGLRFDEAAKEKGVTVVCAGILPGLLELFPIMCSGVFSNIKKINFKLVNDMEGTSNSYPKRHGIGLTPDEYQKGLADGSVGYIVYEQRLDLIAYALGWKLDEVRREVEPIFYEKRILSHGLELEPGRVCGSHYRLTGMKDGEAVIIHDVWRPVDREVGGMKSANTVISIEWEPDGVSMVVAEGVRKSHEVSAAVVNRILQVISAKPGIIFVKDLPLLACLK